MIAVDNVLRSHTLVAGLDSNRNTMLVATAYHNHILTTEAKKTCIYVSRDIDTGQMAYMYWTVTWGAAPAILNVVMAYMVRSEGSTLHASVGTMSGCLLNIVLDPIFIMPWGLNMGAAGAGLATFLSNCVACAYFFVLLYVKRKAPMYA